LRATGYEIVARRNGEKSSLPLTYTKGQYAELNNAIDNVDLYNYFNLFGGFAKGVTSAEGYIERTKEKYQTLTDSIANLNKSLLLKKYMQLVVDTELLTAATLATTIIEYANETNKSIKLSDEQVQHLLEPIDLNDDKLLLAHWNLQYYLTRQIGNDNVYAEYGKGKLDFKSADKEYTINNYLNKKPQKYLSKNKFFNQAFDAKVAEMAKIMLDSKVKIEPTPDVADDKMLEAIIAPHKGKVVLVDFWNTWCGPCLQMHKIVAELREANKDLEEVVWIYIANDSSPLPTYKQMIPEIKGLHYRLADKHAGAWTAIGKQLNITGIPSYVLVEKDGSYKLRNDLRGGEEMVSVLRNSLKK
jgi:thiol-disulfide isomerase/thioredoxin